MIFWKRLTYGENEKTSRCGARRGGEMKEQSTEGFQGSDALLCDVIMMIHVITHLCKSIECITPRVNHKVKIDLPWVLMTC